jgi:uncharacterized protein (TIGR04141 family)
MQANVVEIETDVVLMLVLPTGGSTPTSTKPRGPRVSATFAYQWERKSSHTDEPSPESFRTFLLEHDLMTELSAEALREVPRLHALDADGAKMQSWPIGRCLSSELTFGPDTYILDEGTLLSVAKDYLVDLNRFTRTIPSTRPVVSLDEPCGKGRQLQ